MKKIDKLIKQVKTMEKQYKKLCVKDLLQFEIVKVVKEVCNIDITERILNVSEEQLEEAEKLSIAYRDNKGAFKYPPYKGYDNLIVSLFTTEELKKINDMYDNEEGYRLQNNIPLPKRN